MREYVVKAGDSPASIAAQERHAGCPKCSRDLIDANPHKPSVTYPNGFITFRELRVGERLRLPEKWFNGELDRMPQSYFNALPYANGVTPGVGAPQSAIDVIGAAQAVADAVAADPDYCGSVGKAGSPVNKAVHEFKVAWNANSPSSPVPLGTGDLEAVTSAALVTVLGSKAPGACAGGAPQPLQMDVVPDKKPNTGAIIGVGLGVAAVFGVVTAYTATRRSRRRRRR